MRLKYVFVCFCIFLSSQIWWSPMIWCMTNSWQTAQEKQVVVPSIAFRSKRQLSSLLNCSWYNMITDNTSPKIYTSQMTGRHKNISNNPISVQAPLCLVRTKKKNGSIISSKVTFPFLSAGCENTWNFPRKDTANVLNDLECVHMNSCPCVLQAFPA